MTRNATLLAVTAALLSICVAQSVLTNDAILKMVKAGLGEDIVISTIKTQPGQYATTADDLIALKKAGVSDKILSAMLDKGSAPSANPLVVAAPAPAPAAAAPAVPVGPPAPVVSEVGVYYNKAGAWADLPPEVVNFKTGGVLQKVGIMKGDINGHLNGLHSPNRLKKPVELLVYAPEGVAITEYQLIRLREQKDSREFRTITGGVLHSSGGATRDAIPFEGKKVAPRTYQVTLISIEPGEYGLLPLTQDGGANSGRVGKLYSFRIVDE